MNLYLASLLIVHLVVETVARLLGGFAVPLNYPPNRLFSELLYYGINIILGLYRISGFISRIYGWPDNRTSG